MNILTKVYLEKLAKQTGFIRDTLEKTLRLNEVLNFINTDDKIKGKLALKGGTAINLAVMPLMRLSVDIDLDYAFNLDKKNIEEERDIIAKRIDAYMAQEGYYVKTQIRNHYALMSQEYKYINSGNNIDSLKIEINFMDRAHVFPLEKRWTLVNPCVEPHEVLMLNSIELYSSKLNALLSRATPRDLYDILLMVNKNVIKDNEMLRKCFLFYKAIGGSPVEKGVDISAIDRIGESEVRNKLRPVLSRNDQFELVSARETVKGFLTKLMVFNEEEKMFLYMFREERKFLPEMLFSDEKIIENIKNHPMARWRTREIREGIEKDSQIDLGL